VLARPARLSFHTLVAVALLVNGCREAAPGFGASTASARTNAELMFGALGARFDNVEREPKFEQARNKMGKWALSPSKLINDTSVWTSVSDTGRLLALAGSFVGGKYRFSPRAQVPAPARPGDARHLIRLRQLEESEYEWLATGRARPGDNPRPRNGDACSRSPALS
jgi:hypothetical protein